MAEYYGGNQPCQAEAVPTPSTQLYDVQIKRVANGFIASIGCKVFIAKTWIELSAGLDMYWKDPQGARKQYCEDEKEISK